MYYIATQCNLSLLPAPWSPLQPAMARGRGDSQHRTAARCCRMLSVLAAGEVTSPPHTAHRTPHPLSSQATIINNHHIFGSLLSHHSDLSAVLNLKSIRLAPYLLATTATAPYVYIYIPLLSHSIIHLCIIQYPVVVFIAFLHSQPSSDYIPYSYTIP